MTIQKDVQRMDPDALVSLFTLDTTPIGQNEVYNFIAMADDDNAVSFNGVVYTPIDIEATGFKWDGKGGFPRPKLRIANIGGLVAASIVGLGDIVGARFIRTRTFAKYLDDGISPDPHASFPPEIFTVNQRTTHNKIFIEWQLTSVFEQLGVKLPRRQIVRDTCTHTYRKYNPDTGNFDYTGVTCPFANNRYFDDKNEETTKDKDVCAKDLKACQKRFGRKNPLPTRMFPGVSKTRIT